MYFFIVKETNKWTFLAYVLFHLPLLINIQVCSYFWSTFKFIVTSISVHSAIIVFLNKWTFLAYVLFHLLLINIQVCIYFWFTFKILVTFISVNSAIIVFLNFPLNRSKHKFHASLYCFVFLVNASFWFFMFLF